MSPRGFRYHETSSEAVTFVGEKTMVSSLEPPAVVRPLKSKVIVPKLLSRLILMPVRVHLLPSSYLDLLKLHHFQQ